MPDESRAVGDFRCVQIGTGVFLELTTGPLSPLELSGTTFALARTVTEVHNGCLTIHIAPNGGVESVRVLISAPVVSSLEASGASRLTARLSRTDKLAIAGSGECSIDVWGIEADQVLLSISGTSRSSIVGSTTELRIISSGIVEVNASGTRADLCSVDCRGTSRVDCYAVQTVEGNLSGLTFLRVFGSPPRRDIRQSGLARVEFMPDGPDVDITPFHDFFLQVHAKETAMPSNSVDLGHLSGSEVERVAKALSTSKIDRLIEQREVIGKINADDFKRIVDLATAIRDNCGGLGCG